ncbi:hypothetical protein HKBW3C_00374, partial [Candidatus Hakubella thermalkaliphila]
RGAPRRMGDSFSTEITIIIIMVIKLQNLMF